MKTLWMLAAAAVLHAQHIPKFELTPGPLVLSGQTNPWRFVHAVGEKGALWGYESGRLEAWIYPLKIFRDFRLAFQLDGMPTVYEGEDIIRGVRVMPHMAQLQYTTGLFAVVETLFAPRHDAGLAILLEIKAPAAMRVFVRFKPELKPMWPGSLGGQYWRWEPEKKAFQVLDSTDRYSALIGSPAAVGGTAVAYHFWLPGEAPSETLELHVTPEEAQRSYIPILVSAGMPEVYDAAAMYQGLQKGLPRMHADSLRHYVELDERGTEFLTPDARANEALRWARIALDQLKVCNPHLGCGYVAGIGPSGTGSRPNYAWFFQDALVTAPAYLEYGGADSVREIMQFSHKYQRADGKIAHEVSQSAGMMDWFKAYLWPYRHADAPMNYLTAMGDFYRFTGDTEFVKQSWPSIRKAYDYCLSILDPADGMFRIPENEWGGGETTMYSKESGMTASWIVSLRAVRDLTLAVGDKALASECERHEKRAAEALERLWNPESKCYSHGLDRAGKVVPCHGPSMVWVAWRGILPPERVLGLLEPMNRISRLSDWGQIDTSFEDPDWVEGAFETGLAWPFQTSFPLLGLYRNHNTVQAFRTWMSMVDLRTFNARGALPEMMFGRYLRIYDSSAPHQQFSELSFIPGLVDGILGLDLDVPRRALRFHPHLPPSWPELRLNRFPYGDEKLKVLLRQSPGVFQASLDFSSAEPVALDFSPALPAGASIISILQDGNPIRIQPQAQDSDIHAQIHTQVRRSTQFEIRYRGGVAVESVWQPVIEGDASHNLRVLRTTYKNGLLEMPVQGRPERTYEVRLHTPWRPVPIEGARVLSAGANVSTLEVTAPEGTRERVDRAGYSEWIVRVRFEELAAPAEKARAPRF